MTESRVLWGEAVNVGTMEGTRVVDAAKQVLGYTGDDAPIVTKPEMPTGPYFRVADNTKLAELSRWRPEVTFKANLERCGAYAASLLS